MGQGSPMQFSIHCDSRRVVAEEESGCDPSLMAWSIRGEVVSHLLKAISLLLSPSWQSQAEVAGKLKTTEQC